MEMSINLPGILQYWGLGRRQHRRGDWATVLPPIVRVKMRSSGHGEILKLIKGSSQEHRNDQRPSKCLMGVVNADGQGSIASAVLKQEISTALKDVHVCIGASTHTLTVSPVVVQQLRFERDHVGQAPSFYQPVTSPSQLACCILCLHNHGSKGGNENQLRYPVLPHLTWCSHLSSVCGTF